MDEFADRRRGAILSQQTTNVKKRSPNWKVIIFFQQVLSEMSYYKKLLPDGQRKYFIPWKSI